MTDEMIDMQTTLVFDSWLEAGPELRADNSGDRHLIYEGGGIILDLLLKAENGGRLHVGGQVLPSEQSLNTVADLAVSMEYGKDRSFTHTNALGEFTFHTVPNVKLDLTITFEEPQIQRAWFIKQGAADVARRSHRGNGGLMRRFLAGMCSVFLLLAVSRAETAHTDIIVTMKPGQSIRLVNDENGTQTLRKVPNASIYLIRVNGKDDDDKVLTRIRRNAEVESAESNSEITLTATDSPVSATADLGHAMADLLEGRALTNFYGVSVLQAYAEQPALDLTRVREVRSLSTGAGTRVAYIDTGVDPQHPALQPWLEPGVDLVNGGSTSELDGLGHGMSDLLDHGMTDLLDDRFFFILNRSLSSLLNDNSDNSTLPPAFGHGTMVAGLIHVVAPEAKIFPIKAFDVYGHTTLFRLVEGVYEAIAAQADVLNMSFSTTVNSDTLQKALDKAQSSGVALVAAVGNDGQDVRDRYPAAYGTVYGVAATDLGDRLTSFSNYGRNVAITAPGAFVISTAPGGRYAIAWGTSFSSPIVAGGIALLSSHRGHGQSDASLIVTTADSIDAKNPGLERKLGKGRINLREAFKVKE